MANGIYTALSGAVAQSTALDTIAHNVANAGTTGFRAQRVSFEEAIANASDEASSQVTAAAITPDGSAGPLRNTGAPLDLAISGDGYFAVEGPAGARYTRAGSFHLDAEGRLVDRAGAAVLDEGGAPIVVPPGATVLTVGPEGILSADGAEVARLQVAVIDASDLTAEGEHLVPRPGAKATGEGAGEVVSGALEGANFNVVRGMVELVRVSRSFEALTRMIETYKATDDRAARSIGGR